MAGSLDHKCRQAAIFSTFPIFLLSCVTDLVTNPFVHPESQTLPEEQIPLVLTEPIADLLTEAIEKTGKSKEEVILACLEHGLERILGNFSCNITHL
jgi:hypothetical protein